MSDINLDGPDHNDFEVVSRDSQFGGFEVLRHKDKRIKNTRFFRKSVTPSNQKEFDDMLALQKHVAAKERFATVYPVYTHDDRKWVVMSVTHDDSSHVAE